MNGSQAVNEILAREIIRSKPDYFLYVPKHFDGSARDSKNEHILVFEGPDGSMMAVWTQGDNSPAIGTQINRLMFARSDDDGVTWTEPRRLVGPESDLDPTYMASWGFPIVSASGRIYVIYNRYQGVGGWVHMHTGVMEGIYSDDYGATWSNPQNIPMPVSQYDDPEGKIPGEWIVWQNPTRALRGGYIVGYTHWLNQARAYYKKIEAWTQTESVVEFMRFENVDANPEPQDLCVRYSAWGDKALRAPYYKDPLLSIAQEPSMVRLPDNRLFCAMRSNSGYIWYSLSNDDGETWCNPRPLLRKDYGQPILQPVSCSPIYQLSDGRYVLLHHNNRGDLGINKEATYGPRYPAYLALGEFRSEADQPIWFSESKEFLHHDGVSANGIKFGEPGALRCNDIGVYSSFTTRNNNNVLWHADRKFFLVGKRVTDEFLADLVVPKF
ncbi:sialidase family protein [Paenibacillus koleovorans]|uniref:sialidase family protein n=1 Tax=Paenibacillus koleovorans TaxID=121608 RepID=UPI000FD80D21|nr:sialidase family protein [Paenibacillus koleovorans]